MSATVDAGLSVPSRLSVIHESLRINIFNIPHAAVRGMSLEMEHDCPECGGSQEFYRAASTTVHLGEKTKWRCTECGYGFVLIDGEVDSSA
jgi:rubredoxin